MQPNDPPVIVEQTFAATRDQLWAAITEAKQMRSWFFPQIESFAPVEGFETTFTVEHDGKKYQHRWKLNEVVPNEKIIYDWRYEGTPGRGLVMWEVSENDTGSKLRLTNIVVEGFPTDDPAFHRNSAEEGWNYLICTSLVDHLHEAS